MSRPDYPAGRPTTGPLNSDNLCMDCGADLGRNTTCTTCLEAAEAEVMDKQPPTFRQFATRQERRFRQSARLVYGGLLTYMVVLVLLYTCGEDPFGPMERIGRLFMHVALILSFYKWAMAVQCTSEEVLKTMRTAPDAAGQPTTSN